MDILESIRAERNSKLEVDKKISVRRSMDKDQLQKIIKQVKKDSNKDLRKSVHISEEVKTNIFEVEPPKDKPRSTKIEEEATEEIKTLFKLEEKKFLADSPGISEAEDIVDRALEKVKKSISSEVFSSDLQDSLKTEPLKKLKENVKEEKRDSKETMQAYFERKSESRSTSNTRQDLKSNLDESVMYIPEEYSIIMLDTNGSGEIDDMKKVGIRIKCYEEDESDDKLELPSKKKVSVMFSELDTPIEPESKQAKSIGTKTSSASRGSPFRYNETMRSTHGGFAPRGKLKSIEFLSADIASSMISVDSIISSMTPNVIAVSSQGVKVQKDEERGPLKLQWEEKEGYQIHKFIQPVMSSTITASMQALTGDSFLCEPRDFKYSEEISSHVEKLKERQVCFDFLPPVELTDLLVENVVSKARGNHQRLISNYGDPTRWDLIESAIPRPLFHSRWPSIKEFSKKVGLTALEEYILETNVFEEDWKYALFFCHEEFDAISDYYFYTVKFSLPSQVYPVAQVSANVIFRIEVCRVIPSQCPVKVTFELEGCRRKFDPDKFILCDRPLYHILKIKLKQFSEITI